MRNLEESKPDDGLYRVRHSLAHVLAQAVLEMREGSTLGFGPPIDDGFYYDFIPDRAPHRRRLSRSSSGA